MDFLDATSALSSCKACVSRVQTEVDSIGRKSGKWRLSKKKARTTLTGMEIEFWKQYDVVVGLGKEISERRAEMWAAIKENPADDVLLETIQSMDDLANQVNAMMVSVAEAIKRVQQRVNVLYRKVEVEHNKLQKEYDRLYNRYLHSCTEA